MTKQTLEALNMAIEAIENLCEAFMLGPDWRGIGVYDGAVEALVSCKEALEQPAQGKRFLKIVNLNSTGPLSQDERKYLITESMQCLLEDGELGKLGMLLNRYEETVRQAEQSAQLSGNSEQLKQDHIAEAGEMVDTARHHNGDANKLIGCIQHDCEACANGGWISVNESLPNKKCLAYYINELGNQRIVCAKYTQQYTEEADGDDEWLEYNEANDTYYYPAGWYEMIDNWDDFAFITIDRQVTHWMPLPAPPKAMNEKG